MFIGRLKELELLNNLYQREGFQFAVIYGRRRVGKTMLLTEFTKDKPNVFFVAEEYSRERALISFSQEIYRFFEFNGLPPFKTWSDAFSFFVQRAGERRIVLILDEYPNLVKSDKSISSFLQNTIDHMLLKTNIFLVICGSSMSFMEKDVLSYKSPLYGRKTAEIKVEPFTFFNACNFVPGYSMVDKVKTYGVAGGIPQYLRCFDDRKTIRENIINAVIMKGAALYEEPRNLLKQELREPAIYNTIIEAIAAGASRMNEIATKTGIDPDKCARYIGSLVELRIIRKEYPIGEKAGRKSIYRLCDNLFKFWYRFVFQNIALAEQDEAEFIYDSIVEPDWSEYIGKEIFEDICRQYLWICNKKRMLPFVFTKLGRWWGNNPKQKRQEEIDIVAINKSEGIFCECKWRSEKAAMDIYLDLVEKSKLLTAYMPRKYMIFSKSGFTPELLRKASEDTMLELVDLEQIGMVSL